MASNKRLKSYMTKEMGGMRQNILRCIGGKKPRSKKKSEKSPKPQLYTKDISHQQTSKKDDKHISLLIQFTYSPIRATKP